ncbi:pentatricopeptide repeat-containing protein [Pyrus ussuriensis x Pyrus communis]|uniref:Pentatricopeptide repeat-containing protein n=1 Tax=Pyrus ussuriensis x Pyrus communis TaxID=2448454 RepID=A0A5N5HR12_9ROSA|nr:pentatricopeptide repeat-containing protein [Pyrus ussuriensis x Pyrus communis]
MLSSNLSLSHDCSIDELRFDDLAHLQAFLTKTPKPCSKRPPWTTFSSAKSSSPVSAIHVYNQEMSVGPKSIEN